MKKMLHSVLAVILALTMAFALSACGDKNGGSSAPAAPEEVKGETLADGNISVLVPDGWMGWYGPDIFQEYVELGYDPNAIQLAKDAKSEMDFLSNNNIQINYSEDGRQRLGTMEGATDIEPFTAGGRTWTGYIYESAGLKNASLVSEDNQFSVAIGLERGDKKITLDDPDFLAILESIQVNNGSKGTPGENPEETSNAVESTNGKVAVTPVDGYEAEIGEDFITVRPEGAESLSLDFIEIAAPNDSGRNTSFKIIGGTEGYAYNTDAAYSMEMLEADINTLVEEQGGIYSNPEKVTLGDYDYMRVECYTNGAPAYRYNTVVNEQPYTVTVVGGNTIEIDSDEVNDMISSIVFK